LQTGCHTGNERKPTKNKGVGHGNFFSRCRSGRHRFLSFAELRGQTDIDRLRSVSGQQRDWGREKRAFGCDPKEIDFVLLTHAYLGHCGRLPLPAKRGFRGEIIITAATRELARLVMVDAAHLQKEEAAQRAVLR